MNIIEDLKKLRKNCVCNRYLRNTRCSYGEWDVTKDEIICYIKQEELDEKFNNTFNYYLFLNGRLEVDEKHENYSLNKPFYFIFEDITFEKPVKLRCDNGSIIFRNCVFNKGIYFDDCYSVTFENNIYDNIRDRKIDDTSYIVGKSKNVQFINENFFAVDCDDDKNFNFWVRADNMIIDHTLFDSNLMNVNLKSDYMKTKNSHFRTLNIKLRANRFNGLETSIYGSRKVSFDFAKYSFWDFTFDAPIINYNGQVFFSPNFDNDDSFKVKKLGS